MAAVLRKPRFVLGPELKPSFPRPPAPPTLAGYGDSCFRAQCSLDVDMQRLVTFTGYDKSLGVVDEVENACKLHAKTHPGSACTPTKLTFLPHTRRQCSGQLYFDFN